MSKEERLFLDELRTKSIEAAAEIMESLQRLKVLYDEITDDGSGTPMPRPRPADFFYRLARFEMEHASNVIRLGNSQAEMIFDHVRQLSRRVRGGAGAPTTTQVVTLEPDPSTEPGAIPGKYVGTFEIKNPFDATADARFEISELRTANGSSASAPQLKASIGKDEVARAHRSATVQLTLDGTVDQTLFGEITVYLSADVERQVAKRAIKVRPKAAPAPDEGGGGESPKRHTTKTA